VHAKLFWNNNCPEATTSKKWPINAPVLFEHGVIAQGEGNLLEAEAFYERASRADPQHKEAAE
jgi:hypothetical protein